MELWSFMMVANQHDLVGMWFLYIVDLTRMPATKLSNWETFATLIDRGLHMPRALLEPTSDCNTSTIYLRCLSSKTFTSANSLSTSWKCLLSEKVYSRVNLISLDLRLGSSSIITLIFKIIITKSWFIKLLGLRRGLNVESIVIQGNFFEVFGLHPSN